MAFELLIPGDPRGYCVNCDPSSVLLLSGKGAREQERGVWTRLTLSVFSYGVSTCDLHLDELQEALQESALY